MTIVEPRGEIDKLWGKQRIKDEGTYRMMRYVIRVDHDGKVLLHNVVTGKLVVLDLNEERVVDKLPKAYEECMEQLIADHYLVPENYDEHQQVKKLRNILRKVDEVQRKKGICHYTILPTTACNARCYYCFEHDVKKVTMTEKVAEDVVEYVSKSSGDEQNVSFLWFGGEPTLAANRIDMICKRLSGKGISYTSDMISNGYLFDEEMVDRAKDLWKLRFIQITLDGTEENYNTTKAYMNVLGSPYQRVMHNIDLLLKAGINVSLRMNIDISNVDDFEKLLNEIKKRFGENEFLHVYAYPIIGEYMQQDGRIRHGSVDWFASQLVKQNALARSKRMGGFQRDLPSLMYLGCGADNNRSITITPDGRLVRCPEQLDEAETVGDIWEGVSQKELYDSWRDIADYEMCKNCCFFPKCVKMVRCSGKETCYFHDRNQQYQEEIKRRFELIRSRN